jgi:hypothetical protein
MSERKDNNPVKIVKKKNKIKIKVKGKKTKIKAEKDCALLEQKYNNIQSNEIDLRNPEHQNLLRCMDDKNRASLESKTDLDFLYPTLNDPKFNSKIASKKEFYDNRYEEKSQSDFQNIKEISQMICENTEFELEPHQMFVRNFMSFQTPYNGLLLFHGLGTGKTCSSISVCEEMRTYLQQLGITKRILIVASPAVQKNFKMQLFDERKLREVNGLWNIKACTGNKFIKEINPMNMKGLTFEKVKRQIKRIISQSYHFQGYGEFSNYINRVMNRTVLKDDSPDVVKRKQNRALQKEFSNRMLVIDEVHNLRITEDGRVKPSSENLLRLVTASKNLKLLLLSATPMFNDYQEIIWLLNVLNLNDKRFPITIRDIFDAKGNFIQNKDGVEIGKELLIQKMTGYISYVRGNNPFTFPFGVYPKEANNPISMQKMIRDGVWNYPSRQVNNGTIVNPIELLDLAIVNTGEYQKKAYNFIIESLSKKYPILKDPTKGLSYTALESPLQALNMVYPHNEMEMEDRDDDIHLYMYGKKGLNRSMFYNEQTKSEFRYKDVTLQNFGRIFSPSEIGKYSGKIANICNSIKNSKGIIFVYSQYIDGGGVPVALALEEMGITKFGGRSLFKTPPTKPIDAITMSSDNVTNPAKYIMITGDVNLTTKERLELEMKAITSPDNMNGEKIKVVIVSRAGSEGLDFKNIRQTHILDPWYNLNRQLQIIGRSIRNLSHCLLPFNERNVEVFLYGTNLNDDIEAVDLYIYRLAEKKAKKISSIVRLLKENAVDCLLNRKGQDFSESIVNKRVDLKLASGNTIEYRVGDRDNSLLCDFTSCSYECNSSSQDITNIDTTTYNETFILMNIDKILQRIRLLFKEYYIFTRQSLIAMITQIKSFPLEQIYSALNYLITDKNEYITDMLGRLGRLVNIGDYYIFQPIELGTKPITRFERVVPIDYKRRNIIFNLPDKIENYVSDDEYEDVEIQQDQNARQTGERKEQRKVVIKVNKLSSIIKKLESAYSELNTPNLITSGDKENWNKAAAWAIYNLQTYNNIDKNLLVNFAMFHNIDTLNFKEKKALLTNIYFKQDLNEIESIIKEYFDALKIEKDGDIGIILANYGSSNKTLYTLLVYKNKTWGTSKEIVAKLARPLFEKFQIKDINSISDIIGFMTIFKGSQIVFKSKTMQLSDKGRTNKGQRCDRGEGKGIIINRINSLLADGVQPIKYKIQKSSILSIYGNNDFKQRLKLKSGKIKEVKIGTLQLCAESELIFRYYDQIKQNNQRWFFNTSDALLNKIVEKGK